MVWEALGVTLGSLFAINFQLFSKSFLDDFSEAFLVQNDLHLVTFWQVHMFAYGPATTWEEDWVLYIGAS